MIRNYIFDFGGVLYKIDETKTLQAFAKIITDPEVLKDFDMNALSKNDLFRFFEKAEISSAEFRNRIREQFKINIPDEKIDEYWNATLLYIIPESMQVLKELKKNSRLALLSNTNEIHYNHFEPECREMFSLFDECFFSYKLGIRKPEPEIFRYVLEKMNFKPEETLFADDSLDNLDAAKKLGINVFHVNKNNPITNILP